MSAHKAAAVKIDLPIAQMAPDWLLALPYWAVVEAEIVDVAPHITNATFAVHRFGFGTTFGVTNIETGFRAAPDGATRDEAVRNAQEYLSKKSNEDMEDAFRRAAITFPEACQS